MSEFLNFLLTHLALSGAFLGVLILYILNEVLSKSENMARLSPNAVIQMVNNRHAQVFDIRDKAAFDVGHILGAVNISSVALTPDSDTLKRCAKKPVIISCSTGAESAKMGRILVKAGFEAYCLDGGISGWKDAHLPLVKG